MNKKGFTFIEILIGLSISAAVFIIATSLVVNLFTSTTKSKQLQEIEQVKNDLQAEFGNSVRWADTISFIGGVLQIDDNSYSLNDGVLYKNNSRITPQEVEITSFEILRHESQSDILLPSNSGTGVTSQYFHTDSLTQLAFSQKDLVIDFNWGESSPDEIIDDNTFSVRFTGQIEAPTTSDYTFYVESDDGARLWIDNKLVVDDWGINGFSEKTGNIRLDGGQRYDFRLEYYENFADARLSLYWSYLGASRQIVPTSRLYPSTNHSSIEIVLNMKNRTNETTVDSMKLKLSPRGGSIGAIE